MGQSLKVESRALAAGANCSTPLTGVGELCRADSLSASVSFLNPEAGLTRAGYLAAVRVIRRWLDGTRLLDGWTRHAVDNPGAFLAHLRTLLAVHNAPDLVRLDLPWWTYRAIAIVERFLDANPEARVFEYGSGASTLWLAKRARSVDSVEHEPEWATQVETLLDEARELASRPRIHLPVVPRRAEPQIPSSSPRSAGLDFVAYVDAINRVGGPFALILIDGRAREASLRAALGSVTENGLILLDDAQRKRYQGVLEETAAHGWHSLRTRGLAPCQPLPRETVILSREPIRG